MVSSGDARHREEREDPVKMWCDSIRRYEAEYAAQALAASTQQPCSPEVRSRLLSTTCLSAATRSL